MTHFKYHRLLLVLCLGFAGPGVAATEWLDTTVAIVEDDVILASELNGRLAEARANLARRGIPAPDEQRLYSEVLETMIVESLQLQMADRAGVRIAEPELDQAMSRIAAQNGMALPQFERALAADGLSYAALRESIRRELRVSRVQQGVVGSDIRISEQEVQDYLASEEGKAQLSPEYQLSHLLVSTANPDVRADVTTQLGARLDAGASLEELASATGTEAEARITDLGWRRESELPTLFADAVPQMRIGMIEGPFESSSGLHFVRLEDKRGATVRIVDQYRVRQLLLQPSEIRSEAQVKGLAQALHQRARAGEQFTELARVYSDDSGTALAGGDLGWRTLDELEPALRERVRVLEPGAVSAPFATERGWVLVHLDDRRTADLSREFQQDQARQLLFRRKFEQEVDTWLRRIRDEAYVDLIE